jgi:hypothetical protein
MCRKALSATMIGICQRGSHRATQGCEYWTANVCSLGHGHYAALAKASLADLSATINLRAHCAFDWAAYCGLHTTSNNAHHAGMVASAPAIQPCYISLSNSTLPFLLLSSLFSLLGDFRCDLQTLPVGKNEINQSIPNLRKPYTTLRTTCLMR